MKRRILASLLATVMVVTSILTLAGNEMSVFAAETVNTKTSGTCGETVTWTLTDGTLTISGNGEMEDYTYDTPAPWYDFREEIESIIIEDGISVVGDYAFYDNTTYYGYNVESISISDSVKVIGSFAFAGCHPLEEVDLPAYIEKIGHSAFYGSAIKEIHIPKSLTDCKNAFSNCDSLSNVTFETGIKKIPEGLFAGYQDFDSLVSVEIPDTVTVIGKDAFGGCSKLTSVIIPESVTEISWDAFYQWDNTITICAKKHSYAEAYAYQKELSFESTGEIANGIVGNNANGIPDTILYKVLINECDCNSDGRLSVGELGTLTFLEGFWAENLGGKISNLKGLEYCINLFSIQISNSTITNLDALKDLKKLEMLYFLDNEIEDLTPLEDLTNLTELALRGNKIKDISALRNLSNLTLLYLSENYITDFSPIEGKNIENLEIGNQRSYDLNNAEISLSATSYIYDGTAKQPTITVTLNDEILTAGTDYTITYSNNTAVGTATVIISGKDFYVGSITKTFTITKASIKDAKISLSTTSYNYDGKSKKPTVTVKLGNKKLVKDKDYTISYKNNKNIGTATVTIKGKGNYTGTLKQTFTIKAKKGTAFTSGSYKYKVTGTSTVAFNGIKSTKTTKVTIPKTVKYGGKTFKVTSIADKALKGKTKVTQVTIGANVKTIGVSAFEGCKKLSKVTIGSAVTTFEDKAFKNCTALKSITIPSKVTKIDKQAFYGCKKLKTITIKSTKLKTVEKDALKAIYSKATIKVPKSKLSAYKKLLKGKGQGSKVKIVK